MSIINVIYEIKQEYYLSLSLSLIIICKGGYEMTKTQKIKKYFEDNALLFFAASCVMSGNVYALYENRILEQENA